MASATKAEAPPPSSVSPVAPKAVEVGVVRTTLRCVVGAGSHQFVALPCGAADALVCKSIPNIN